MLRQRSRPYLFSNTLAPMIAAASLTALDLVESGDDLRERLASNAAALPRRDVGARLRARRPRPPDHPGDARRRQAHRRASPSACSRRGVYVTGFSFPVVPKGQARIRTQMSAAHDEDDVAQAIAAFAAVGRELGVIA